MAKHKPKPIRCDVCGRFVDSTAHIVLVTPDSEYTSETYSVTCKGCENKERIDRLNKAVDDFLPEEFYQ